jgi:hypothetical protein
MTAYTYSIVLNDAYFFLNQSEGLPNIPTAEPLRQRYLRTCVLFSWIAVEGMVDYSSRYFVLQKKLSETPKGRLLQRINAVLSSCHKPTVSDEQFKLVRKVRNALTHPTEMDAAPELDCENARSVFEWCRKVVELLAPHQLLIELNREALPEKFLKESLNRSTLRR